MAPRRRRARQIGATQPPDLILDQLDSVDVDALETGFSLEDVIVGSAALARSNASAGCIRRAHLQDLDISESTLRSLALLDVSAERIDAANGDWTGARLRRVRFSEARMTGVSFAEAQLQEASFTGCKLDYANFRHSRLEHVSFEDCVLSGADFQGASVDATLFSGCQLVDADFSGARLSLVDLRGSRLALTGSLQGIRGAIIDSVQLVELAPALAHELGIIVEDR